jgi:hypothetical protein
VSFKLPKPAFLPFHTITWGQFFVQTHNCPPPDSTKSEILEYQEHGHLSPKILNGKNQEYVDSYRICTVNVFKNHHGLPFNATYHPRTAARMTRSPREGRRLAGWLSPLLEAVPSAENKDKGTDVGSVYVKPTEADQVKSSLPSAVTTDESHWKSSDSWNRAVLSEHNPAFPHLASIPSHNPRKPIKYVYYTECDQVVRYDSMDTFRALVAASNETTFFVGRRREKRDDSPAEDYMSNLDIYRQCGSRGFSMRWPKENIVQIDG